MFGVTEIYRPYGGSHCCHIQSSNITVKMKALGFSQTLITIP